MRITVLGAGTVGTSIADMLCQLGHSVTVIDTNPETIRRINDELDVMAVEGSASQSSVLFQAGMMGADLCLAVTGCDETNLVAASIAKAMGVRRSVARVYAPVFRDLSTFDYQRHFNIDRLISMEHLSAMEMAREIRHPGAGAVESFARGEVEVQELAATDKAVGVGVPLSELKLPTGVRIGSIRRDGKMWIAGAADRIAVGDLITLIGKREQVDEVRQTFQRTAPPKQSIVIAGGGETGYHLALALENRRFSVLLIEADRDRCEYLATHLKYATVVNADFQRRANLEEERVGNADVFVACAGDDEDNIMACVEAKELGAKKIMSIVSRPDYANVVGKLGVDHTVSPREVVADQIRAFLNVGALVSRVSLSPDCEIEVLEIEVSAGAAAEETTLAALPLPPQCLIAAQIRNGFVHVPGAEDRFRPGDSIIAMVHRDAIADAVRLFEGP